MAFAVFSCGGDEADNLGVGAQCQTVDDCGDAQQCLTQFKGGYCGLSDCESHDDCPGASSCVTHGDGKNYCFRHCLDKAECNANRAVENEANCSSSANLLGGVKDVKVCIPPSSSN
ncbi:MAG: hypothetical protein H0U74_17345 [Bradymonadaceae bacterium]|nr:hypothetical protein [Lujinxingiaceae bacterium]